MSFQNIKLEKKGSYAILTVNRPQVLNALNGDTMKEIAQGLGEVEADETLRVLLVTGEGKAFIAGADINELKVLGPAGALEFSRRGQEIFSRIGRLRVPVIAAVNGFALGGGCELAMACDWRIASEKAKFGQPEVNLGVIPGYGGTQRLARLIGRGRAFELLVTGDLIDAKRALEIGLVNAVHPVDQLMPEAEKIAATVAAKPPAAVRLIKQCLAGPIDLPLSEGLEFESRQFGLVFDSEDRKEGIAAFLEKRKAHFTGK